MTVLQRIPCGEHQIARGKIGVLRAGWACLVLVATLFALSVGTSRDARGAESFVLSCSEAPAAAVIKVPAPATSLVGVACTGFGHVLTAADGWKWVRPASGDPVFLPAQLSSPPRTVGHAIYFSTVEVRDLKAPEAKRRWEILAGSVNEPNPIERALEIGVRTNEGKRGSVYLFENGYGYLCTPTCSARNTFLILSREGKKPQW